MYLFNSHEDRCLTTMTCSKYSFSILHRSPDDNSSQTTETTYLTYKFQNFLAGFLTPTNEVGIMPQKLAFPQH